MDKEKIDRLIRFNEQAFDEHIGWAENARDKGDPNSVDHYEERAAINASILAELRYRRAQGQV